MPKFFKKEWRRYSGVIAALIILIGAAAYNRAFSRGRKLDRQTLRERLPFELTEVSQALGLVHRHEGEFDIPRRYANVAPFVASSTASVSVVDYDSDGYPDIYVNSTRTRSVSRFFHNNGDGTFTDVAEKVGLARFEGAFTNLGAFFFDFDNDGFKDALVIGGRTKLRLFRNVGGVSFDDVTDRLEPIQGDQDFGITMNAKVPAFVDYDGDGFLDIVVANQWSREMPNSLVAASNGGEVYVYHNDRGRRFRLVVDRLGFNHVGFSRSIGLWDIRGTGRPDIWFANDFAPDHLYFNEGRGRFRDVSERILTRNFSRNGMNSDFADLDNDGHPVVFVSHIFQSFHRMAGNTLWKWVDGDDFAEISRDRGVNRCGWAWGGKFLDLDNDGNLDLVVGNGFISRNPEKQYWYFMSVLSGSDRGLVEDPRNWPPMGDASLSGFQRACVFYNDGTGHFRNVAPLTGWVDDLSDERGLATVDYLNTGVQSLAVANQNQAFKFYQVKPKVNFTWIGFKLRGTRSNRDAFGSIVKISLEDGRRMTRQLQTTNGYGSQSDDRIHFGLGPTGRISSVEILWPSGLVSRFAGSQFALGRYHTVVEEGS